MNNKLKELSEYRLEQASTCLLAAKTLIGIEDYKGGANRAYYAIFHSIRSVLALDEKDFAKHSGVSAYFRKEYIKTGIFDVEYSDIIKEAFDMRSDSDYDDFYIISKAEVDELIINAEKFHKVVSEYVNKRCLSVESSEQ